MNARGHTGGDADLASVAALVAEPMIELLVTALLFRVRPLARSGSVETAWLSGVLLPGGTALKMDA